MQPRIRLSRLRDIGLRHWDPIGCARSDGQKMSAIGDEYDDYLLKAARLIRHEEVDETVVQYLVSVESQELGMGIRPDARSRAEATIAAIRNDNQLWTDAW